MKELNDLMKEFQERLDKIGNELEEKNGLEKGTLSKIAEKCNSIEDVEREIDKLEQDRKNKETYIKITKKLDTTTGNNNIVGICYEGSNISTREQIMLLTMGIMSFIEKNVKKNDIEDFLTHMVKEIKRSLKENGGM